MCIFSYAISGSLTTVEYDRFDTSLLAELMDNRSCLIESVGGQVDGRGYGTALPVGPPYIDEKECLGLGPVLGGRIGFKELHDLGRFEARARRLELWECVPPGSRLGRLCHFYFDRLNNVVEWYMESEERRKAKQGPTPPSARPPLNSSPPHSEPF